jgi:nucleoside-diphosphate-sugar epimerase
MKRRKVLLLGGTGRVGPGIIQEYLENYTKSYDLILGYHRKKPSVELKSLKIDLKNINSLRKAFKGVDVVVNLAANSTPEAKFVEIIEPNVIGAYNVFEAARLAKCSRVVFASSVHTIKGHEHGREIGPDDAPRPLNFYGASKVFGEALCSVFSNKYDLSCFAVRIGAYVSEDQQDIVCRTRSDYDYVISQGDLGQLIHKCIMAPKKLMYGIFSGTSDNEHKRMELRHTRRALGYKPKDDAFTVCKVINKKRLEKE